MLVPSLAANDTMRAWGSRYARLVLKRCGNNKRRACQVLGISYHTLQAYLKFRAHEAAAGEADGSATGAPSAMGPGARPDGTS